MKKSFSLLLIFGLVLSNTPSHLIALDTSRSGRILDNFKEQQQEILFSNTPIEVEDANVLLEQEYQVKGLEGLKNRLSSMQVVYRARKDQLTDVRMTLEQIISDLDASIKNTEEYIVQTRLGIYDRKQRIQKLKSDTIRLKAKIREHRGIILSYISNIYSEGHTIMNDNGNVDIIKGMILTEYDTDYVITNITYKALVAELGQIFVEEYREMVRQYYEDQITLKNEEKQLEELQGDLEHQSRILISKKEEREKLLEVTAGQEARYVEYIASQERAHEQIEGLWIEAQSKYKEALDEVLKKYKCHDDMSNADKKAECARLKLFFENEKALVNAEYKNDTKNIFEWPTESQRITTYYREDEYYDFLKSHHDAIDIASPQSSDVRAIADGYVIFVLPPSPGGYSYLALKHKDGFVSVYGHLSEVSVKQYDFVKSGEVFAKSGGEVGTPGAGPMTTGPHLHFELWKNRESVDPLRYLSLADMNYETLSPLYQDKFISDIMEKAGTGSIDTTQYKKKFNLIGNNELERQKYLLKTYAVPEFQNWKLWVDTSLEAGIDPSFMMCIGLAETTLGNYLKTPYNIGNIGNTDSGDTYSFSSPREGIEWMARTFNNRFLGKYTKISELSRWGNPDGTIYASSNANWHINTVRCLSALKGEFVSDDFEFRTNTKKYE